ncbi:MAG: HypC/HybG/HupF family hydrogenase formation chaperone [Candidatus Omnitrophica bacterium]|nr:HypC/HybG/HupF family hydrogenase formation chaperone [Candidatus Omnitrophota bacterium]
MCLAIPGKIESITGSDADILNKKGRINFGGIFKEVLLSFVPKAKVGDYVIVHAGVALSVIDETEAMKIFDDLKEMETLEGP